jgi:hypothetical protein
MSRPRSIRQRIVSRSSIAIATLVAVMGGLAWVSPTAARAADKPAATEAAMVDSPWFNMGWPKVEMPKMNWKPSWMGGEGAMTAEKNPVSRGLDKVADTSKQAAGKVRDAWGAAVEKLSFGGGGDKGQAVAANDQQPGFWSKMFGGEPAAKPQGSETVQEFLAQERPGTVR